jgi:hypothetical protein
LSCIDKGYEAKILIDNQFLGWLSSASGHTPKEVLYNLYDISTPLIQRMNERDTSRARTVIKYTNSDIEIAVNASVVFEWKKFHDDNGGWGTGRGLSREDPAFNWIKITTKLKPSEPKVISRDDIETMMLEQFLLGKEE